MPPPPNNELDRRRDWLRTEMLSWILIAQISQEIVFHHLKRCVKTTLTRRGAENGCREGRNEHAGVKGPPLEGGQPPLLLLLLGGPGSWSERSGWTLSSLSCGVHVPSSADSQITPETKAFPVRLIII